MLWLGARLCENTGASRLAYNRKHSEIATKKRRFFCSASFGQPAIFIPPQLGFQST